MSPTSRRHNPLYWCWRGMHKRCRDPNATNYRWYGGRGIKICQQWYDFDEFCKFAIGAGWRKGWYIDRLDCDGHYEPENVRFVSKKESAANRRCVVRITANGYTRTISEWVEASGIGRRTIERRRGLGWSDHDIINGKPSMTTLHVPNHACVSCGLPSVTAQCAPCAEIGSAFFSIFRSQHRDIRDRSPRVPPAVPGEVERGDAG